MEKDKLKMQAGYEIMDQILSVVTENESWKFHLIISFIANDHHIIFYNLLNKLSYIEQKKQNNV
jgi:Cdc6-like AAA superfamily ATPase